MCCLCLVSTWFGCVHREDEQAKKRVVPIRVLSRDATLARAQKVTNEEKLGMTNTDGAAVKRDFLLQAPEIKKTDKREARCDSVNNHVWMEILPRLPPVPFSLFSDQ